MRTLSSIRDFADARSVAIIGASARKESWGYSMTERLIAAGYKSPIQLVNRAGGEILGHRVYKSIDEIPGEVDLALATLGNEQIFDIAKACAKKGVRGLIVYTAGFAEVGEQGAELQKQLVALARSGGMRVIGPNCNGLFNARLGLNLTGNIAPPPGPISFISQSGNLGLWWFGEAAVRQVGLSHYFSLGNMADIKPHEYLEYLGEQENAKVVVVCLEALPEPRNFIEVARRVSERKPILGLKLGRTSEGARAALTHTASIAGSHEIAQGLFRQARVIPCRGLDELIEVAEGLALLPRRPLRRIVLIGGGGGHATTACDEISQVGLETAILSSQTRERLRDLLPWWANVNNPVEFAGGADQNPLVFSEAVENCLSDPKVDAALIFGLFGGYRIDQLPHFEQLYEEAADNILASMRQHGKPIVLHSVYANRPLQSISILRRGGVTVTASLSTAARILQALASYTNRETEQRSGRCSRPVPKHSSESAQRVDEREARDLLRGVGIPCIETRLARTATEAVQIVRAMGKPVALRVASAQILHKRAVGGVAVGIGEPEIEHAFSQILTAVTKHQPGAKIEGIWISPLLPTVAEFAVGAVRDPAFGDVVMCGLGGPLIEQLHQRAFRLAPLSLNDAKEMIDDAGLRGIADGVLGPVAEQFLLELSEIAVKLGDLLIGRPQIVEVDLNPVLADGNHAVVVDPRVLIASTH